MITKELINEKVEQLRKELLDMVEPKFEVGKWYIEKQVEYGGKCLFYFTTNKNGYGFTRSGNWTNEFSRDDNESFTPATPSEVQAALEAEAFKRGFVKGVMVKPLPSCDGNNADNIGDINCNEFIYRDGLNELVTALSNNRYNSVIFKDGVWVTIIPQEKTSEEWADEYHTQGLHLNNWLNKNNLKITKK